jgi:hypothetical protein
VKRDELFAQLVELFRKVGNFRNANTTGVDVVEAYMELCQAHNDVVKAFKTVREPEEGYVGANHPETSRQAAKAIKMKRGTLRSEMLNRFHLPGAGYTDAEMQQALVRPTTASPGLRYDIRTIGSARISLRDYGFVEDSGERRPSPSGNPSTVWVITDLGKIEWDRLKREEDEQRRDGVGGP